MADPKQLHWFLAAFQKVSQRLPGAGQPSSITPFGTASGRVNEEESAASPSRTVAFVFTDVEDSSTYWDRYGTVFQPLKQQHDVVVRRAAGHWQGQEITPTGDGFLFIFSASSRAIRFAVELQAAFVTEPLTLPDGWPLKVRVGIHVGEALEGDGGTYDGPNTSLAARVCAAGHGGQILASREAWYAARANLQGEIEFRDLGSYRMKGFAQETALFQILAPSLPSQFPPLTVESSLHTHLPAFSTPFIGRTALLAQLTALLNSPENRLVVLAGPGGVGKTRLSVQAAEAATGFADGIWFVDLQTATHLSGLFARIVLTLGLRPLPDEGDEECALRALASRTALLVLDNLEQVEDAAAGVGRLLRAAPRLRLLVTTREWLPMTQARIFEVGPLSLPSLSPPDGSSTNISPFAPEDAEAARATESVQFFLERASSHPQDFQPDAEGIADIARLCLALDGVPLALELAAGWISVMEPKDILDEMRAQSRMLESEYADLPERQRTVQASLDWSYGRLRSEDQALLSYLSVFSGGFNRPALDAVCGGVLPGVRRLVEHSLLTRHREGEATRYHLLNITRAYAAGKLSEREDAAAIRDRHAQYFARLAAECVGQWRTAGEGAAFAALERERENLQAALDWSQESRQSALAAKLLLSRGAYQERQGFLREARQDIDQGRQAAQEANLAATPLGASLLRESAGLFLDLLELVQARSVAQQFLDLCRSLDLPQEIGYGRNLLGATEKAAGRYGPARDELREALSCFEESGATLGMAIVHNNLGLTEFEDPSGDRDAALRWWEEALALFHQAGDRRGVAEVTTNLGNLAESQHHWDEAAAHYAEALDLELSLDHAFGVARGLSNLGEIALAQGRGEAAYRLCAGAQALLERAGSPYAETRRPLLSQAASALGITAPDQVALVQSLKRKPLDALVRWAREPE